MSISEESLASVRDRETLFTLLRDQLGWEVNPEDTFTYRGPSLEGELAERAEISQIVPFSGGDPYTILLAEFSTPFRRGDLREILRRVRAEIRTRAKYQGRSLEDLIFICANRDYAEVRFARFEQQEGRQPKLSTFGWDTKNPGGVRTLLEFNLPALRMPTQNVLGEPDWGSAKWQEAWSTEKVTKDFFAEYRRVFQEVEAQIVGVLGDKRLFTQRLFNRLLFIQFLSKKGWLEFERNGDYLTAMLKRSSSCHENFFRDRLYWAFFYGLGSCDNPNIHALPDLQERRGTVPFLNGGLFELVDANDVQGAVTIPNSAFERVISGLFAKWNFTVTESTPLDIDVAVDPEMLGKVFEELVTGRHESGSYYTPRPVVAFMCREALKGYLETEGIAKEAAAAFVDERSTANFGDRDFELALSALKRVKVVDPACGSGAYLLGMLHELVELRRLVFNANRRDDPKDDYHRKLEIIQNNLYGVDKDEFAVNIARLRLWLSLAVEYDGDDPPPLPNLDFKIEAGDSVASPDPSESGDRDMFRDDDIAVFERCKAEYAVAASGDAKFRLRSQVVALRQKIASWAHPNEQIEGFDWRVEFAEVFQEGGFDIVLANPPYGIPMTNDYSAIVSHHDSFTVFMGLANCLAGAPGVCSYIVPTSWETGERFSRFRQWLLGRNELLSVVNLPYDVFDTPYVDTGIVTFRARSSTLGRDNILVATLPKRERGGLENIASALRKLPVGAVSADTNMRLILNVNATGLFARVATGPRFDTQIRLKRGIAHYKYDIHLLPSNEEMRPFYDGAVYRYRVEPSNRQQWVLPKANDLEWHSGERLVVRRLVSRGNRLMAARMSIDAVVKESLLVLRPIATQVSLRLVLGFLNSSLLSYLYLSRSTAATKDDFRQVTLEGLHSLPLPKSYAGKEEVEVLVGKIESYAASGEDFGSLDQELDAVIYAMYGVTDEEQVMIERFLSERG